MILKQESGLSILNLSRYQNIKNGSIVKNIDKDVTFWIFEFENTPSGVVRFEKYNRKFILHYQIAPQMRGKKLASFMIETATEALKKFKKAV